MSSVDESMDVSLVKVAVSQGFESSSYHMYGHMKFNNCSQYSQPCDYDGRQLPVC